MSNTTVGQYLFNEDWAPLVESLKSAPELKVEELKGDPQDIVTYLSGEESALIFISLASKDDLIALANLVKMSRKVLKEVPHKFIVVNFTGNKNVEKAIMKMGILDILDANLKARALRFKIDFWEKSLAHTVKNKPLTDNKREIKKNETAQIEKKNDIPLWIAPLELESDIWLVKNELEIKKILGRWLVKLMGPSSHVASWVEVEGQSNVWRFLVKETYRAAFHIGSGDWFFRGDNKPDYNWKEHLWTMAGDKIELIYLNDNKITPRFVIKDKILHIAKNSDYAKTKIQIIEETFSQEHIFKKDIELADTGKEIEADDQIPDHLKGKSTTENIRNENLSGKTKTGSDEFSDMSGKGSSESFDYGAMKGKSKGSSEESDSLYGETKKQSSQTIENPEESHNYLEKNKKSYLDGKSSTDFLEDNYKHQNKNESPLVDSDEDDRKKSDLLAKSESSGQTGSAGKNKYGSQELEEENKHNKIDKYYKNHNEATSYDEKDLSGKGKRADEIDGHLSSLEKKKKDSGEAEDQENPNKFQETSGKDLSDKGNRSDELGGHLSSKEKNAQSKKVQERSTESDGFQETAEDNVSGKIAKRNESEGHRDHEGFDELSAKDLSGKGVKADELNGYLSSKDKKTKFEKGKDHSTKNDGFQEKSAENLSGKGSRADKLDNHLSSKEKQTRLSRNDSSNKTEHNHEKNLKKSQSEDQPSDDKNNNDLKNQSKSSNNKNTNKTGDGIYHPSANIDSFVGEDHKKKNPLVANGGITSQPSNIYPIRPSLNKVMTFLDSNDENEKQEEGESSLAEMSESAKIYSFISQGSIKRLCDLDDYFDDIAILRVSGGDFVELQNVQLDLSFHYMKEKLPLKVEGIIEGIEPDESNFVFVTVRLKNEDIIKFEKFVMKFQKRQSNIDQFMKRAKGL